MTASACTDKVGFVNYRLDVASENQQVFSKRKPKNVIHIIDVTLHEQKERWELFYLETVKTVMVDRTLHESSVMSTVTDSLIADQEPKHSVDTDSLQAVSDNSRLLVSSQTSTSTVAPEVVVSNLCTGMVAVETDGGLSSLPVKSHQAYETVDVKQLEQHDNDESCDLPASHDSRATDSGIETSNHGLPLSSEEPDSESRTPVRSSLGKLDVACENQQVFSKQQPKDMTHIVDTTLCEQRERWELFHLEIVRTVMVDRTLHESSVTSSVTDSLTANQEPKHSVETDSLQSVSEYDKTDNSKLLVSSENGPVTDIPTHVSEAVYTDIQAVERDPGLASLSVTTLEDQLADYDQVQEHKNVQSCDLPGNNDNISVVSGIQTSDHGLPVSPEEPLSHKPSSESVVLDHNLPVDIAEESALPADVSKPTHSDVSVIQLAHSEADNMTTIELRTDVTTDYTVTEELEGTHSSTASEMEIHSRLHPENNSLESSEVETKQSQAKGVVDAAVTEHLTTPVDTQDVTFLPAADMGQPDTISCKLMDMDAVITVQTSNDGNTHGIEHIYAHMQPRYDETGVDKADMQCDDETGVVSVDKLPHDDQRVDTQPHDDETGVDRVDKLPHDDHKLDTQPRDDDTGLDRIDMQCRDDYKVDIQPCDDETGVDRVDKLPHDDQRADTQRGDDETGLDRMDMQSRDDHKVDIQPRDDETGLDRVDKLPHDDQRADTQRGDDETGVDRMDMQSRDDHKVDTQPRGDEIGLDRMDMQSHDHYRVYTQGDDETGVDRVDKLPHDDQGVDTQRGGDETGLDRMDMQSHDDQRVDTQPHDDETGLARMDMQSRDDHKVDAQPRDDETGVDRVDRLPHDQRADTQRGDDETGVDRTDMQYHDDQRVDTQPHDDETGLARMDMQFRDDHKVDTQPRDDETGVDRTDMQYHDDQRVDTQPHDDETGMARMDMQFRDDHKVDTQSHDDETGPDRMDMQSHDDYRVYTQGDDETGVDRVDNLPHGDHRVDTEPCDHETGLYRMDMQSRDDYRVYTEGDDETGVERVDKVPHDDQRADTQSGDDETGVPNVSVSESGERLIVDTEKPAFLEYGTYATESFTETCSTEEKPADVVEADIMAPDETSELGDRHIQKPVAAIDAVTLRQSVPEEFSEIEHDDGEGEPAAAKTLESLDIKDSSHEPHGRLFSEVGLGIYVYHWSFLLRDAMHSADSAVARYLSVCHKLVFC